MDPEVIELEAPAAPMSLRDSISEAIEISEAPEPQTNITPARARETPEIAKDEATIKEETVPQKPELKEKGAPKLPIPEEPKLPEAPPIPPKKAPSSWSVAQREKWGKLDPDLQTQILKREREISNGFNEIGEVKKFRDTFLNTINPHQSVFQAEGNDPIRTISNLLQAASTLYHGNPAQKAATVAAVIKNFSIDIAMLDDILSGQTPQGGGAPPAQDIQRLISQGIQQALGPVFQMQQKKEQEAEQTIVGELQNFADDPANEFYEDVKMTMADILDLAANRNEKMSLQTAYQRAILMHSDIADVVQERKLREAAQRSNVAAQAARRRGGSISGAPTPSVPGTNSGGSLRSALEDAMEQSST